MDMQELATQARKRKAGIMGGQRERYKLARELGFTSYEALVLQNQSKETIRHLAEERKANK